MPPILILLLVAVLGVLFMVGPLLFQLVVAAMRGDDVAEAIEDGFEGMANGCGAQIGKLLVFVGICALAWLAWYYWPLLHLRFGA